MQENKEVLTEVTSIAKEEEKTGQKIKLPNPEELVQSAAMDLLNSRRHAEQLMAGMPKRGIVRAIVAAMDLPQDGIPVRLQSNEEKTLFLLMQKAYADKSIVLRHYVLAEKARQEAEEAAKVETSQEQHKE